MELCRKLLKLTRKKKKLLQIFTNNEQEKRNERKGKHNTQNKKINKRQQNNVLIMINAFRIDYMRVRPLLLCTHRVLIRDCDAAPTNQMKCAIIVVDRFSHLSQLELNSKSLQSHETAMP